MFPPPNSKTGPLGTRFTDLSWYEEVDSTNRVARELAVNGAREGLVVVADHQSAGRGRLGRHWEAPAGMNLLVSVLLRPALAVEDLHLCTTIVALAAADACRQIAGVEVSVKWPNDLLVGERKLAGILGESLPDAGGSRAVVVGLGCNVGWPRTEEDCLIGGPNAPFPLRATSLERESGGPVDREALLSALLVSLERRRVHLETEKGRHSEAEEYRRACSTLGSDVRVELGGGEVLAGRAVDLSAEGCLVLDIDGAQRIVAAGDVVHVRSFLP
jgi:BirA family biotin operon repressor/biotin-[acetyl-CoA-carboxylase] ligase